MLKKIIIFVSIIAITAVLGMFTPKVLLNENNITAKGDNVDISRYNSDLKDFQKKSNANLKDFDANKLINSSNVFDNTIIKNIPDKK